MSDGYDRAVEQKLRAQMTQGRGLATFQNQGQGVGGFEPRPPTTLPIDSAKRKAIPLTSGCLDYFPAALAAVAEVSRVGNEKHNPGQPLHHSRGKSSDHADCIARHLVERGSIDASTGLRHSAELAWRALALLQEELEAAGEAPLARGARLTPEPSPTDSPNGYALPDYKRGP